MHNLTIEELETEINTMKAVALSTNSPYVAEQIVLFTQELSKRKSENPTEE